MFNKSKINLFLVDDDALFLKALEIEFLDHANFNVKGYNSGESCLNHLDENPDVIILDYHMDSVNKSAMNGIEVMDKIKVLNPDIPIVILSSQQNIEVAIDCMQHRAFDYVVKSETAFKQLQIILTHIFSYRRMHKELNWYV